MKVAVMACMRNEAMFVLEWVAYHRCIGFDPVFVCTNDCSDGTDEILDALESIGLVVHVRNDDHGEVAPQPAGVAKVLARPELQDCRWLLHIDADEFLNIHVGDGRLDSWIPSLSDFDAVAVRWRVFGDSGLSHWPKASLQMEAFTMANAGPRPFNGLLKTMFDPAAFEAGIDHMPKRPTREITLCNAEGQPRNPGAMYDTNASDHSNFDDTGLKRKHQFPWRGASLNHYAVRTEDLFLLKNFRGDAMRSRFNKRYFLNSRWHRAINKNDVEEPSIQRHLPATKALMVNWRAEHPNIADIESRAYDWYQHAVSTWLTQEQREALTA